MFHFVGADRGYKKRRRGGSESNNDLEDRLESLILKVGEKVNEGFFDGEYDGILKKMSTFFTLKVLQRNVSLFFFTLAK